MEVVAVNDITAPSTLAHLLSYDSTYGRLGLPVLHDATSFTVDGKHITVSAQRDPAAIDCAAHQVGIVIESSGRFRDRASASLHLKSGTRKVLLSAPGKASDLTVVMGVNHDAYDPLEPARP